MDDEDIDIATNKLRQQPGETFVSSLRPLELNDNVLALDIAEVAQARPKGLHRFCGPDGSRGTQKSDPGDLAGRLRARRERPKNRRRRRASKKRDELAPLHAYS